MNIYPWQDYPLPVRLLSLFHCFRSCDDSGPYGAAPLLLELLRRAGRVGEVLLSDLWWHFFRRAVICHMCFCKSTDARCLIALKDFLTINCNLL